MSRYFSSLAYCTTFVSERPRNATLAVEAFRLIDDLLDARHVRSERGDDDAAVRARENVRKSLADDAFGERMSRPFGVGRIGEHAQHAGIADARDGAKSAGSPSIGVWSNLKSPVWKNVPSGVRIAIAHAPASEWLMWMNSAVNSP